jgi:muramoyltetrapeptide carboxypeptidase LdcA involved in peptidoglycan recycling
LAGELQLPAAIGFPVGHIDDNCAVPLGVEVELDASSGKLTFMSGLLA